MTIVGIVVGLSDRTLVIHRDYVDAVLAAGGTPLLIPATTEDVVATALGRVDALLLAGGGDVHPARYRATPAATLDRIDPVRDGVEIRCVQQARADGIRVLGICRGAQVLAVATGGQLVQDLPSAGFDQHIDVRHDRAHAGLAHAVKAEPNSLAERILGGAAEVNSHHHQAIAVTGDALVATAWSPDGAIEAVEGANLLGVQWHPETAAATDRQSLRAFQWLVHGERGLER